MRLFHCTSLMEHILKTRCYLDKQQMKFVFICTRERMWNVLAVKRSSVQADVCDSVGKLSSSNNLPRRKFSSKTCRGLQKKTRIEMRVSKDKNEMEEYSVPPEMNPTTSYVCIRADKGKDVALSFVSGIQFCYVSVLSTKGMSVFRFVQSFGSQSERFYLDCILYLSVFDYMELGIYTGVGE